MKKALMKALAFVLVLAMVFPLVGFMEEADARALQAPSEESIYDTLFWESWQNDFESLEELMEWFAVENARWFALGDLQDLAEMPFWATQFARSADSFSGWYNLTEAQYAVIEQAWENVREDFVRSVEAEQASLLQHMREELTARGGTYGIMNVMINNTFMRFDGAVPEIIDGTGFVPAAQFLRALGWAVNFDPQAQTITAARGGDYVRISDGENAVVTVDGWRRTVEGCSPFIRDGVFFMPLRAIAEAMGYYVFWDDHFRAVIVIGRSAVIAELDRGFTVVNRLLNTPMDIFSVSEGKYETVLNMLGAVTMFNSIDGDMEIALDANVTLISQGYSFSASGEINLTGLLEVLSTPLRDVWMLNDEVINYAVALENVELEIIMNSDSGTLYMFAPFLSSFMPELDPNAWISIGGLNEMLEEIASELLLEDISIAMLLGVESFGEYIFPGFGRFWHGRGNINMFDELVSTGELYRALLGDSRFVRRGDVYSLSIRHSDFLRAMELYGGNTDSAEFDVNLTVELSRDQIVAVSGEIGIRTTWYSWGWTDDFLYAIEFEFSRNEMSVSFYMHERNRQSIQFEISLASTGTDAPLPAAPPPEAVVISLDELLGTEYTPWIYAL
ncbi:MAG: copper amine oxidase N-terminal domain-containing protein [Oscillospiraceae bacterium]|nr:copper amine oxidase N-terminal domain-containing protein [Oscillospiraceae bacterium]